MSLSPTSFRRPADWTRAPLEGRGTMELWLREDRTNVLDYLYCVHWWANENIFYDLYAYFDIKGAVLWIVVSCISEKVRHFGSTYCLHLRGWGVSQARNQQEASRNFKSSLCFPSASWLTQPWRWRWYVPSKCRTFSEIPALITRLGNLKFNIFWCNCWLIRRGSELKVSTKIAQCCWYISVSRCVYLEMVRKLWSTRLMSYCLIREEYSILYERTPECFWLSLPDY
jgi:hypothetical protein